MPKESIRLLGTGVIGGCEPPLRCLEINPGCLEEQPVLSAFEPSLQPLSSSIILTLWYFEKDKMNCLPFPNLLQSDMAKSSFTLSPVAFPLVARERQGCGVRLPLCTEKLWNCPRALLANGRVLLQCRSGSCTSTVPTPSCSLVTARLVMKALEWQLV